MVRIGNGTVINTPLGLATVTYRQVTENAQTGASVYDRYITIGGKTDNGTVITDNFPPGSSQAAAIPLSNTLLDYCCATATQRESTTSLRELTATRPTEETAVRISSAGSLPRLTT